MRSFLLAGAALFAAASASPLISEPVLDPRAKSVCGQLGDSGIKKPKNNATIHQTNDETTFEVIYCSGQYFKTSSQDASVWLSSGVGSQSGELWVKNQAPDNLDAVTGSYSYRLNVTLYPEDGYVNICFPIFTYLAIGWRTKG